MISKRLILAVWMIPLLLFSTAANPRAETWNGTEIVTGGVRHIRNPAEGIKPPVTIELAELWRLGDGSEADEELFGLVRDIAIDGTDNIYVVDYQLSDVRVFSPDGKYLRSIGREGEGPGEYRRPTGICIGPGPLINIIEAYPSRIKQFTLAGDPAGTVRIRETPESDPVLIAGIAGNDSGIIAHCLVAYPEETGGIQHFYLCSIDQRGFETNRFFSEEYRENPAKPVVREKRNCIQNRWAVSPDGSVILSPDYYDYTLEVWNRTGTLEQVITRAYEHRKRSTEEKQFMLNWIGSYRAGMPPDTQFQVEEYDKDIMALFARGDGSIWVLTSRGYCDRPDGSIGVFDLFDCSGHFVRSVTLMGEGDPFTDRYYFLGNRLYVVRHFIDALVALRGGSEEQIAKEEMEAMSIICYEIELPE
jgi:hypothetical protein